jgi:hypothetical protein
MEPDDLEGCTPQQLACLLSFETTTDAIWPVTDLAAILKHQLALIPGADRPAGELSEGAPGTETAGEPFGNYWELFRSPQPSLELLQQIKDVAKAAVTDPDAPLPEEVATVIYFAAIAVALIRCNQRITRLSDEGLRLGFRWSLDQSWIPEEMQALFQEAMRAIPEEPS